MTMDNPVTETRMIDPKTGDEVILTQLGSDDYVAYWMNGDCSVRGTLQQVLKEINGEG